MFKKIIILCFIVTLPLFIAGCSTTNTLQEDVYCDISTFKDVIGGKCLKYIQQDQSLSSRDKNTLKIYYDNMQCAMKKINVKK